MKVRILLASLAVSSLMSISAFAAGGHNHSSVSQHGFANVAGVAQVAGRNSANFSHISQFGAFNAAVTGQAAFGGGTNSSSVSQHGVGNVAVTSQAAF